MRALVRQELRNVARDIDEQIDVVVERAHEMEIPARKMMDQHGNFILGPLLIAKANVWVALSNLER